MNVWLCKYMTCTGRSDHWVVLGLLLAIDVRIYATIWKTLMQVLARFEQLIPMKTLRKRKIAPPQRVKKQKRKQNPKRQQAIKAAPLMMAELKLLLWPRKWPKKKESI